jgi:hypothetical protein
MGKELGSIHFPYYYPYFSYWGPLPGFPSELILNYAPYRSWKESLDGRSALSQGHLPTHDNKTTYETRRNSHVSSGIRTDEPSVYEGEDISCLRPRGHCPRL